MRVGSVGKPDTYFEQGGSTWTTSLNPSSSSCRHGARRASDRITYLDGGYANDNYRFEYGGERFVIRIVREPAGPRDAEMRYLQLPLAPDVVAVDRVRGDLITRWIEGTLLAQSPAEPPEMAMYLRELHSAVPLRHSPV